MTGACKLCGRQVDAPSEAFIRNLDPTSPEGLRIDLDVFAAYMWLHISQNHPSQTNEGVDHQRRAAKLYALRWAAIAAELRPVETQLRSEMVMGLAVITAFAADPDQYSPGTPDSDGSGSNVKKSDKNSSRRGLN